jgi:hypothetical protein
MKSKLTALALCVSLLAAVPIAAQQPSSDINARIRREATDNSQIMRTLHVLTDLYGPRLTGSPNHKAAAEWVRNPELRTLNPEP